MGSFSLSMGCSTTATGRASTALGVCTKASGEGELACGLYTEETPATGVVLRVGTGHEVRSPQPQDPLSIKQVRHDALRVNADGALYLRKKGGTALPDVQEFVETLQKELHETQAAFEVAAQELAATRSEMAANKGLAAKELAAANERLVATNAELASTKQDLSDTTARLSELENRFKAVLGKLDVFKDVSRM